MQGNRKACAALSALLLTGAAATAAHGDDTVVPPKPCTTASFIADPAGDAATSPLLFSDAAQPAPDNMDLTGFYLTTDENGTAFANIKLKNASLTLPSRTVSLSGISYYLVYRNIDGVQRFVEADVKQDPTTGDVDPTATEGTLSFSQGSVDQTNGLYTSESSTNGTLFAGKDGVVQVQLPDVYSGDKITDVMAFSYGRTDLVAVSSLPLADAAPDGADAGEAGTGVASYPVPDCTKPAPGKASAKKAASAKSSKRTSRTALKARLRRAHR